MQASQAHIIVDQNYPEGQPRKVIVTGRQDGVMRATKMITELIHGEPGSAQSIIQKVACQFSVTCIGAATCSLRLHSLSMPVRCPLNHLGDLSLELATLCCVPMCAARCSLVQPCHPCLRIRLMHGEPGCLVCSSLSV